MDAMLVMFRSDGQKRDFALTHQTTIVGRKNTCDLRIPLSSVSREHCQIEVRDDSLYLRDLGSSNGTFYNDERVQETELQAGDRIKVGPVNFAVVIDGEPADLEPIATVLTARDVVGAEESDAVPAGDDGPAQLDAADIELDLDDDDEARPQKSSTMNLDEAALEALTDGDVGDSVDDDDILSLLDDDEK